MKQHATFVPHAAPVRRSSRHAGAQRYPLWVWTMVGMAVVGPLFLLMTNGGRIPDDIRMTGGILWILSWVPAIAYLAAPAHQRPPVPALPMMGILFGLYYPFQLLLGFPNANDLVLLDPAVD